MSLEEQYNSCRSLKFTTGLQNMRQFCMAQGCINTNSMDDIAFCMSLHASWLISCPFVLVLLDKFWPCRQHSIDELSGTMGSRLFQCELRPLHISHHTVSGVTVCSSYFLQGNSCWWCLQWAFIGRTVCKREKKFWRFRKLEKMGRKMRYGKDLGKLKSNQHDGHRRHVYNFMSETKAYH